LGFQDIKSVDWSDNVAPFWGEVYKSATSWTGVQGLLSNRSWETIKGALVVPMMQRGYEMGLIKFVVITGTKAGLGRNVLDIENSKDVSKN
jgi:tocopherol O-methyltransferase